MSHFKVVKPADHIELEACYDLRWRVLRAPWHQARGSETDELEAKAENVLVKTGTGEIVGTGRLHKVDDKTAQIRYMAIEEGFRNRGIGEIIYRELERLAGQSGIKQIIVNARLPAVGFYERMGLHITGDGHTLYKEIKHKIMEKKL